MRFENSYDKNNRQLIIELTLLIPNHLMSEEFKATDVSNEITDLYKIFYDAQNKIYKKNYQNHSSPSKSNNQQEFRFQSVNHLIILFNNLNLFQLVL